MLGDAQHEHLYGRDLVLAVGRRSFSGFLGSLGTVRAVQRCPVA